jgi:uncharacterized repeat protein (TIGR01451 family)
MNMQVKGKAIIGIAIAAIMLATLMAMVPAVSAKDVTSDYLTVRNGFDVNPTFVAIEITTDDVDAIKIGQEIIFKDATGAVLIEGIPDTNTDGEAFSASAFVTETVTDVDGIAGNDKTVEGIYFDTTSMSRTGTYILSSGGLNQQLSVSRPTIPIELKVGPDVVSTLTVGTKLRVDCSGASDLGSNDCVDLVITDPRGRQIKTWTVGGKTQYFDEISVDQLIKYGSTDPAKQIDTTDWILGSYTFYVVTEEENARGLDLRSPTKTLTLLKGEVNVDVDKTEVGELQPVTVTVTGIYGHTVTVEATTGVEYVEFEEGLYDFADTFNRESSSSGVYKFDVIMEEEGQMLFSVRFHDTGTYTLKVTDFDTGDTDTEDVKVSEKDVTFDMPSTVVIGEDLEVRGMANAGDYIDIAIEDYVVYVGITIEADGSFEEDLPTPETPGTGVPGSIVIEAFIRMAGEPALPLGEDVSDIEEDGSTSVLLTAGSLTAEISTINVAQEDSFTVYGTAEGYDFVDIVTIAPKGGSGSGINPASVPDVPGITHDSSAVSDLDYSYLKDIYVDEDADTGKYMVVVVTPGCNGVYDGINSQDLFGSEFVAKYGPISDLASKTQGQILAIIEDATIDAEGSDDLLVKLYIKVETPMVHLNPIADVTVGEPLVVTGQSNREEGYTIIVTAMGPTELTPQTAQIENGTFEATFDTTGAVPGEYTVMADDGDGHTDEATVEILPAITPPEVTLKKSCSPSIVPPGGNVTYTINYTNSGEADLHNVVIIEYYPEGVTFISASPAPDHGTNNKWTIGTLAANTSGEINITVKVRDSRAYSFFESGGVIGEGFVMVSKDIATGQKPDTITNLVTLSCTELGPVSATASTTVSGVPGTSISVTEHGSGIYESDESLMLCSKNRSISIVKSTNAVYRPTTFNFSKSFSVNFTPKWKQDIETKNCVLDAAIRKRITDATYIEDEMRSKADNTSTTMEFDSYFNGSLQIDARTNDTTISETYIGEFNVLQDIQIGEGPIPSPSPTPTPPWLP